MRRYVAAAALTVAALFVGAAGAEGQQEALPPSAGVHQSVARESVVRQPLDDAWWTGPMLAPSAATLPRGHFRVTGSSS